LQILKNSGKYWDTSIYQYLWGERKEKRGRKKREGRNVKRGGRNEKRGGRINSQMIKQDM
jgi:hypothetical protein